MREEKKIEDVARELGRKEGLEEASDHVLEAAIGFFRQGADQVAIMMRGTAHELRQLAQQKP